MAHEGHRQRLRKRFLTEGLDFFERHNILELLLFYALPRRDTNLIAHSLLESFGSFSAVFDAPYDELIKIKGLGENAAALIKLIPQICRVYLEDRVSGENVILNTEKAGKIILPHFVGRKNELVLLICLDNKHKVLHICRLFEGSVNSTQISTRRIVEVLLRFNATSAIIAHNHPGGLALPSREDIETTRRIKNSLKSVGIELIDHIIEADGDFVSLAESGFMD